MNLDKLHPRFKSLIQREALVDGYNDGVTALAGLIAHGRGEAYDYILGEKTLEHARKAIKAAAALLLLSSRPVISVNGNTAVLCPEDLVKLANVCDAEIEVNLFHRTEERILKIEKILNEYGAKKVLGISQEKKITGIASNRKWVAKEGIYSSDTVLVPLEDGDRTEALVKLGKKVITIDLNPFSRTSKSANITIVDNVIRAVPLLIQEIIKLKKKDAEYANKIIKTFDNNDNLKDSIVCIRDTLN